MFPDSPFPRCPRCTAALPGKHCSPCTAFLSRAEHPNKMTPHEIHHEVRSWLPCNRDNFPVDPNLWARRMAVILRRDVTVGEMNDVQGLLGETIVKYPKGGARRR